jgi:hypothetical protein
MQPEPDREGLNPGKDRSEEGVDLTLIRYLLSLTPAERLQLLQNNLNALARIREYRSSI